MSKSIAIYVIATLEESEDEGISSDNTTGQLTVWGEPIAIEIEKHFLEFVDAGKVFEKLADQLSKV